VSQENPTKMSIEEARAALAECERSQLGDRETSRFEVSWTKDSQGVASGWFELSAGNCSVWFSNNATFTGADAWSLRYCGTSVETEFMQPSAEEDEAASLELWAKHANEHPYGSTRGCGVLIDIGGELYTGRVE
jgi:hypothetical protein